MLLSRFSPVRLCDPIDSSPPGSPVPGILQARTPEWVAISFSNAWKWKVKSESEVAQWCPTLGNSMDCSPSGSSIHGILQARALEWGAIAFSNKAAYISFYWNQGNGRKKLGVWEKTKRGNYFELHISHSEKVIFKLEIVLVRNFI